MNEFYENDNNMNKNKNSLTSNNFNGLILSDSMCKYVRLEKVSSNGI